MRTGRTSSSATRPPTRPPTRSNDEAYLDGSSVAAQGLPAYTYAGALPHSSIDPGCKFYIEGDAPDASLVDTSSITTPTSLEQSLLSEDTDDAANDATETTKTESQLVKGIDRAAALGAIKADVISESFGNSNFVPQIVYTANDAAVAAGIPVVVSSGDSGISGTINPMSADPLVISTGAVDNNRLIAINDNYATYKSNQIAALSSGGVATTDRLLDLVGPGWYGEAACAPNKGGCPNYPTEAGRGTSESAPLTAGAIADIIQAYRDTPRRRHADAGAGQGDPDQHGQRPRRAVGGAGRRPAEHLRRGQGGPAAAGHDRP